MAFSPINLFTSSIQGIFSVLSFFSQIPPQNSTNFQSQTFFFWVWPPSNVLKKLFWSRWNLLLSCFLLLFLIHFSNLSFFYLNLSVHCSFVIFKLLEVSSLIICTLSCFKIFFLCFFSFYFHSEEFIVCPCYPLSQLFYLLF